MTTRPTLQEFRDAVAQTIGMELPALPQYEQIPDDVAELPCVVIGLPSWSESSESPAVNELELDLWLLARRQQAGGHEEELLSWAQQILDAFGGTRRVIEVGTGSDAVRVHMLDGASRVVDIAGQRSLAYQMSIIASAIEC